MHKKLKYNAILIIFISCFIFSCSQNHYIENTLDKSTITPTSAFSENIYIPYITNNSIFQGINIYNVKEFGATGDRSKDDTFAIQSAINKSANNGMVYFPPGEYIISSTIVFPTKEPYERATDCMKYHLYSPGNGMTTIIWNGEDNQTMFDMSSVASGSIVEGLSFRTNKNGTTGIYAGKDYEWGAHIIRNNRFTFLKIAIDGGSKMESYKFAYFDSLIDNCIFYGNDIAYDSYGSAVKITNGSFLSNKIALNINEIIENSYNKSSFFVHGVIFAGNERDVYLNAENTRIHSFTSCWFETSKYGIVTVSEGTRRLSQGLSFYGCQLNTNSQIVMDFSELDMGAITIIGCNIYGENNEFIVPENIYFTQIGLTNQINQSQLDYIKDKITQ